MNIWALECTEEVDATFELLRIGIFEDGNTELLVGADRGFHSAGGGHRVI